MSPYFDHAGVTIYCGDCREVLPALACRVDMVLADPPYGDTVLPWDVRDLSWLEYSEPLVVASGSVWCFGSLRMFMAQAQGFADLGWRMAQEVVWEKHNGSGFAADRFKRVHEIAAHFYRTDWDGIYKAPVKVHDAMARSMKRKASPKHMGRAGASAYATVDGGPRLMTSVIQVRSCHGYAEHPTQKPIGILAPLLEYSCPPGGLVLDPTMGSGSTLVAARSSGRRAIGIEQDERYCEIAARRVSQELPLGA